MDIEHIVAILGAPAFLSLIDKVVKLFNYRKQKKNGGTVCKRLERIENENKEIKKELREINERIKNII